MGRPVRAPSLPAGSYTWPQILLRLEESIPRVDRFATGLAGGNFLKYCGKEAQENDLCRIGVARRRVDARILYRRLKVMHETPSSHCRQTMGGSCTQVGEPGTWNPADQMVSCIQQPCHGRCVQVSYIAWTCSCLSWARLQPRTPATPVPSTAVNAPRVNPPPQNAANKFVGALAS